MEFYYSLPAIDDRWDTSSMDSLRLLIAPEQDVFSQIVLARVELIRLVVFSAIEMVIHFATATIKFVAALIPKVCDAGLRPWVIGEACSHVTRSMKLGVAILCSPLGVVRPQWTVELYQMLTLVKAPTQSFGRAVDGACSVAKETLGFLHRNLALCSALTVGVLVVHKIFKQMIFLVIAAAGVAFAVTRISFSRADRSGQPPSYDDAMNQLPDHRPSAPPEPPPPYS